MLFLIAENSLFVCQLAIVIKKGGRAKLKDETVYRGSATVSM